MPLVFVLLLIIVAIFIEIAGFIVIGSRLGVMPTLALLLAAIILGMVLLRMQLKKLKQRLAQELDRGQIPERSIIEGMMMVIASILLIIPGFVGDVIGLLLFVPVMRALLWRRMAKYVTSSAKFYTGSGRGQKFEGDIIDLEVQDYQAQPNEKSPWRRVEDEKNSS